MRNGAVKALESEATGAGHGSGEVLGLNLKSEIAPVETHVAEGWFNHGLGGILRNGESETTHKFLFEIQFCGHSERY